MASFCFSGASWGALGLIPLSGMETGFWWFPVHVPWWAAGLKSSFCYLQLHYLGSGTWLPVCEMGIWNGRWKLLCMHSLSFCLARPFPPLQGWDCQSRGWAHNPTDQSESPMPELQWLALAWLNKGPLGITGMDPGPEKVSYSEIKKSGAGKKVVQRIKSVQRKMELKRERERGRKGEKEKEGRIWTLVLKSIDEGGQGHGKLFPLNRMLSGKEVYFLMCTLQWSHSRISEASLDLPLLQCPYWQTDVQDCCRINSGYWGLPWWCSGWESAC